MNFRILANEKEKKKFFLEREKIYAIPPAATHIHIYAGKYSWFPCLSPSYMRALLWRTEIFLSAHNPQEKQCFSFFKGFKVAGIIFKIT